ncbi:MAG TPA: aconitate hydratase [Actinomycetales bacterium]|nr:aconitate hydratase [Actinomycetales bacterium]
MSVNSFGVRDQLQVGDRTYEYFRLDRLPGVEKLPFSTKILAENLLRYEDGHLVTAEHITSLLEHGGKPSGSQEIQFRPARVLLQDFTGVPCVVDLVAMRNAMADFGGDAQKINPLIPAELVIDHSVIADAFGTPAAFDFNAEREFERNQERYQLLRWAQQAFDDFVVVPPDTGICHQVNLEYLARTVFTREVINASGEKVLQAYPDTLVGTDSHTPMINGLGVLGWGVGGIEAEAAMLGQPMSMLIPDVVGMRLSGELPEGTTATDLVLTVAERLRQTGVVGKFVEFFGPGVASVPLANRATLGNMSPEYGSTVSIFPIDSETLNYLRLTGRSEEQIALVEAYAKAQGLWHDPDHMPEFAQIVELDLSQVEPSIAGPKRPQDRIPLRYANQVTCEIIRDGSLAPSDLIGVDAASNYSFPASDPISPSPTERSEEPITRPAPSIMTTATGGDLDWPEHRIATEVNSESATIDNGHVVIAAITSCTNTSNPEVMLGAGLLAQRAVELGLQVPPWVKTSLAPGSRVVTDYFDKAGLTPYLEKLGFHLVGYGCTTCIGNSGPLIPEVSQAISDGDLSVCSVLSGNRNFEGRIHPETKLNFLMSPPLVIAYALAGTMRTNIYEDPLGFSSTGQPVFLKDIWPSSAEIQELIGQVVQADMFTAGYEDLYEGDERWRSLPIPDAEIYTWEEDSTYIRRPNFFEGMPREPEPLTNISNARVLAVLGDSVTTDHISPAGAIRRDSPAGQYLMDHGVEPRDFNSYGSRRGNHEVMIRGTFANIRLRNLLVPGVEGGVTKHMPSGEQMTIFEAAQRYAQEGTDLVVFAGAEYGSGSSRDWAAKGTYLLGVRAVIATSFERIHRSNLIGMGVLPLQFRDGVSPQSLSLDGSETFSITGLAGTEVPQEVQLTITDAEGTERQLPLDVRIDTPAEAAYYHHGGILQFVLRELLDA